MGITPKDIAAQRAMLERGEQIIEAKKQQDEHERLRDTFAAAADVVSRIDRWLEHDDAEDADQTLRDARTLLISLSAKLEHVDAMLRERERTVPAAPSSRPPETRASGVEQAQAWSCDLRRYVTADEEQRMANHDATPTIDSALETLSRSIGVYGKRIGNPFSIQWSNGITAFVNGTFVGGGRGNVARAIVEHGMPDMSKKDDTIHDAAPAAKAPVAGMMGKPDSHGTGDICERLRRWFKDVNAVSAIDLMDEAASEIDRLREAIRRLADQDATLSVQGGNVAVTMDATLTDAEREAVEEAAESYADGCNERCVQIAATLRNLLERTSC